MQLLAWDDNFVTGIDSVDHQHRGLVELVNRSAAMLASETGAALSEIGSLLNKLMHYAATHFTHEETLMRQAGLVQEYQDLHRQAHQEFVQEVIHLRGRFEQGEMPGGTDLLRFMVNWLTFHILAEDQRMAHQLKERAGGVSAEAAWAAQKQRERGPQAVYVAALLDLFALVTLRNRQLDQAQQELREANQALEAKVQARTQELAQSNTALRESLGRLQQTQQQLLQSEKMAAVGQLAAGVAHEINNPLGFVNANLGTLGSYVQALLAAVDATEAGRVGTAPATAGALSVAEIREDLPDLLRESRDGLARVTRIVGDLREFAHLDAGTWAPADLNVLLESALSLVAGALHERHITVHKALAALPPVDCMAPQLTQVWVCLLRNAAQAVGSAGELTLRSGYDGQRCWIEVQDNGCGMTAEVQQRIFEPFFTTRPVGQGTGLGLSMAWDIVARHQGHIDVSSAPGRGSCFRVSLPRQHAATLGEPPHSGKG